MQSLRKIGAHAAGAIRDLCNLFWQMTTLQGAVIVSIQSPVGERRIQCQLDPDQEASEGPIIKAEERPHEPAPALRHFSRALP